MDAENEHRIFWDDENQVVRALGKGTADEPAARWFLAETERMALELNQEKPYDLGFADEG